MSVGLDQNFCTTIVKPDHGLFQGVIPLLEGHKGFIAGGVFKNFLQSYSQKRKKFFDKKRKPIFSARIDTDGEHGVLSKDSLLHDIVYSDLLNGPVSSLTVDSDGSVATEDNSFINIKDVDIFFETEEDFLDALSFYEGKDNCTKIYDTSNSVGFEFKDKGSCNVAIVDLVRRNFGSPQKIIGKFDFTVTQCAMRKKESNGNDVMYELIYTQDFLSDYLTRTLRLTPGYDDNNMFERLTRYINYGYKPIGNVTTTVLNSFCRDHEVLHHVDLNILCSFLENNFEELFHKITEYMHEINSRYRESIGSYTILSQHDDNIVNFILTQCLLAVKSGIDVFVGGTPFFYYKDNQSIKNVLCQKKDQSNSSSELVVNDTDIMSVQCWNELIVPIVQRIEEKLQWSLPKEYYHVPFFSYFFYERLLNFISKNPFDRDDIIKVIHLVNNHGFVGVDFDGNLPIYWNNFNDDSSLFQEAFSESDSSFEKVGYSTNLYRKSDDLDLCWHVMKRFDEDSVMMNQVFGFLARIYDDDLNYYPIRHMWLDIFNDENFDPTIPPNFTVNIIVDTKKQNSDLYRDHVRESRVQI